MVLILISGRCAGTQVMQAVYISLKRQNSMGALTGQTSTVFVQEREYHAAAPTQAIHISTYVCTTWGNTW